MTTRPMKLAVAAVGIAAVGLSVTACGGGGHHHAAAPTSPAVGGLGTSTTTNVPTGYPRTFQLADATAVTADVPAQPVATVPSSIPGVTLQLYAAQRQGNGAVLVVFAVDLSPSAASSGKKLDIIQALDLDYSSDSSGTETANNVAVVDAAGLKEYETFNPTPNNPATCLCSNTGGLSWHDPGPAYLAALVAAPPASAHTVSVVTGLGSFGNVTLTQ